MLSQLGRSERLPLAALMRAERPGSGGERRMGREREEGERRRSSSVYSVDFAISFPACVQEEPAVKMQVVHFHSTELNSSLPSYQPYELLSILAERARGVVRGYLFEKSR